MVSTSHSHHLTVSHVVDWAPSTNQLTSLAASHQRNRPQQTDNKQTARRTYLCRGQLLAEHLHLVAQVPDDPGVGVLVDDGVVDDALGAVGVAQRGQRLLVVVGGGADGGHHHRLAVAAQVVLKHVQHNTSVTAPGALSSASERWGAPNTTLA